MPTAEIPAINRSSSGFADRDCKLPHTEGMWARFPVTLTQLPFGIVTPDASPEVPPPSLDALPSGEFGDVERGITQLCATRESDT